MRAFSADVRCMRSNTERSRTPPRLSPSARRRRRRELQAQGREILSLVKPSLIYSREVILAERHRLRVVQMLPLVSAGSAPGMAQCQSNGGFYELAVPANLARQPYTLGSGDFSARRLDSDCSIALAAATAPLAQSRAIDVPGNISINPRVGHNWNVLVEPFNPYADCCEVDWQAFNIDLLRASRPKLLREPNLFGETLHTVASPSLQQVETVTADEPEEKCHEESSEDEADCDIGLGLCPADSDIEEEFLQEAPESHRGWYINLVPERYKWKPAKGVGEREWNELVQSVAVRVKRMQTGLH